MFMGVPTMYSYLLQHYHDHMTAEQQQAARAAAQGLRLTVSGSAACPVVIMDKWRELSGQMLLERYGMTETGMILSNPYQVGLGPGRGAVYTVAAFLEQYMAVDGVWENLGPL